MSDTAYLDHDEDRSAPMTPFQTVIAERHRAFHAKIAAQAKPDPGISCPSALARTAVHSIEEVSKPDYSEWVERQKKIEIPNKEPWFCIVAEIKPIPPVTVREIIAAVAYEYELTPNDILSDRRLASVVRARQVAMYLTKEMTGFSFPALGRQFGYRDHTTVLHGVRKIERLLTIDADLKSIVDHLKVHIRDKHNARYIVPQNI